MIKNYESLQRFCLDDKIIVVTGGTGILGSMYCKWLAEAGGTVIVADLDIAKCEKLAENITAATG